MRRWSLACLAGAIGFVLLLGTGCTKSIQANSGSKSFEQGMAKRNAPPSARPNGREGNSGSRESVGGFSQSNVQGGMSEKEPPPPASVPAPAAPIPSLSNIDPSQSMITDKGSGEQRVPGDMIVAKVEPSDATGRRLEEMQREQVATVAAGLEDVFFGFDTWQISNEGKQTLMLDAEWIKANPGKMLVIEGHCDERGTLAYNLVLGEKRAKAIQRYLVELGVSPNRLAVVSYGKERPFCKEHDETCYQQNRRGHIVVRAQ